MLLPKKRSPGGRSETESDNILVHYVHIYISSAVIFLERYDAYFYFNIVYNDLGKNVFHKKAQPTVRKGTYA